MPAVQLPPGRETRRTVLVRRALEGTYDVGDKLSGIVDLHKLGLFGQGRRVGVIDTGKSHHPDLVDTYEHYGSVVDRIGDDDEGHGTHVASILRRPLPKVAMVSCKALDAQGGGSTAGIARAVDYMREMKCDVVNMSLGGGDDPAVRAAIQRGVAKGIIFMCAAGNSGLVRGKPMDYPALLDYVAAVGACNAAGEPSRFSSQGKAIDLTTYGEGILGCGRDSGYVRMDGTSMATPLASAMVILRLVAQDMAKAAGVAVKSLVEDQETMLLHVRNYCEDKGANGFDVAWGWGVPNKNFVLFGIDGPAATTQQPLLSWGGINLFEGSVPNADFSITLPKVA